jgi:hypothetical protein
VSTSQLICQTTLDLCWKDIEQSISNPGIEVSTPWIGPKIGLHWGRQCTNGISPTLNSSDSRWVFSSREYDALDEVQILSQDSALLPRTCVSAVHMWPAWMEQVAMALGYGPQAIGSCALT